MEKVGLIQMTSGPDPQRNLAHIGQQVAALAAQQVKLVVTPENALVFGGRHDYHSLAETLYHGPLQRALSEMAKQHHVWLLVGSMPIRRAEGVTTTSLLFSPQGEPVCHYDKLHMFDVDVADSHQRYRESETFTPGNQVVTYRAPFAHLGLTICYDVRFPTLYSELAQRGANIIVVPAAFTAVTGRAHWQTLLSARAIETQAWVIAVNQVGTHPCGRETWGHSMVISPWGEVVAALTNEVGNLLVDIDLNQVEELRVAMPVQQHARFSHQLQEN
ncbi:carbon-nitrogen hydrolase family protein [Vibrio sp. JPW-9-11-11]|uniref:carbon-nitrogen hydrolase family protein n=1 Tax=Vibrio sp. JPW-9-11-11 TaxID=1416532 RepID=UPI0015932692|nr:carbon-nitrogen hydrolase family protein [Vibrio sp. JPW-9-11-11]NVD07571.1 carbon-nitrogen hydrolase family protein [Vibrio sp. JPW-9-11-11]